MADTAKEEGQAGSVTTSITESVEKNTHVDLEAANSSERPESSEDKTEADPNIVDFDSDDDPTKAVNWPRWKKWSIVGMLSALTFITPLASSMFAPGVGQVMRDFNSDSLILSGFVVSVYILGYATGPLFIAPFSELYGRAIIYHVSNVLFVIFTIACAVSSNLGMLIGFRFLEGIAGSCVLTNGGGTVADLFIQQERGRAMAIWSAGPLLGPVIGT